MKIQVYYLIIENVIFVQLYKSDIELLSAIQDKYHQID